jgi:hypothetical protein
MYLVYIFMYACKLSMYIDIHRVYICVFILYMYTKLSVYVYIYAYYNFRNE